MVRITTQFLTGALVGIGVAAGGYYLYKKNQTKINNFLRSQGINIPCCEDKSYSNMTLEELMLTKEKIEDTIAEKEMLEKKSPEVPQKT